jgi:hypothetical protein
LADRKQFTDKTTCKEEISRNTILERLKKYPGDPGEADSEVAGDEAFLCAACANLKAEDVEAVRAARQRSTRGLSDEALYDYVAFTKILMTIRHNQQ